MSLQQRAVVDTIDTATLETPEDETTLRDRGEVPLIHNNTVLTNAEAINARQSSLDHWQQKLDDCGPLTDRDTRLQRKKRVQDLKDSLVIAVDTPDISSKRNFISNAVEPNIDNCDDRLLAAIYYASTNEQVTDMLVQNKVVKFYLEDNTHIEATKLGDCIAIQGRGTHNGQDVARSFPETCDQEADILSTIQHLLDPQNGWAIF